MEGKWTTDRTLTVWADIRLWTQRWDQSALGKKKKRSIQRLLSGWRSKLPVKEPYQILCWFNPILFNYLRSIHTKDFYRIPWKKERKPALYSPCWNASFQLFLAGGVLVWKCWVCSRLNLREIAVNKNFGAVSAQLWLQMCFLHISTELWRIFWKPAAAANLPLGDLFTQELLSVLFFFSVPLTLS